MSDVFVAGHGVDTAVVLLAAAEDLEQDAAVVRTVSSGFLVPREVAEEAGVEFESDDEVEVPADSDLKAAWVDYAVSQGADRDEAEASTKAQLIEQFKGKE